MKTVLAIFAISFSTLTFAAGPVCKLISNQQVRTLGFDLVMNENADIPGWKLEYNNGDIEINVLNADGHYFGSVKTDIESKQASVSDKALIIEVESSSDRYTLNCPKFIY